MAGYPLPSRLIPLTDAINRNCAISDARDNGIYSMCTLFLRLRNLYKWEHGKHPWQEAEPAELLDWIEKKEEQWLDLVEEPFRMLPLGEVTSKPDNVSEVNQFLSLPETGLLYGAGHGRSLKAIFFLAEIRENRRIASHPVHILDREFCRELSSPFAMHQDGVIYFRLDPFRYFLWDKIQETEGSKVQAMRFALSEYGLIGDNGKVKGDRIRDRFEEVVQLEMEPILFHELGELVPSPLAGPVLSGLIGAYPDSPVELVVRATKDILADTCEGGMLRHIIEQEKTSSLGFYVAMLDGMRRELFPEFKTAFEKFLQQKDWRLIDDARLSAYNRNLVRAEILSSIAAKLPDRPAEALIFEIDRKILGPLGLPSLQRSGAHNA